MIRPTGEQIRAAILRVLETNKCGAQLCDQLIPMGSGLCERHEFDAALNGPKLVAEVEFWLRCESDKEQQNQ